MLCVSIISEEDTSIIISVGHIRALQFMVSHFTAAEGAIPSGCCCIRMPNPKIDDLLNLFAPKVFVILKYMYIFEADMKQ